MSYVQLQGKLRCHSRARVRALGPAPCATPSPWGLSCHSLPEEEQISPFRPPVNTTCFIFSLTGALTEKTTLGATPVPRDTLPSRDTSVRSLTQEKKLPVGNAASSTPSVPMKEKVGDLCFCHLDSVHVLVHSLWLGDFLLQCHTVMSLFQDFFSPTVFMLPSPRCMVEHGRREANSVGL